MIILHIAENIYGGGAENVFYQTISSLLRYDTSGNKHFFAFKAHPGREIKPHLNFGNGKSYPNQSMASIYSTFNYRLLKAYLADLRPDLIHLQLIGNLSPAILRAVYQYKKRNKKVKVIQTVHSFEHICSHQAAYDYRKGTRCLDCAVDHYKTRIFYRFCSRAGGVHALAKGAVSLISDFYFNKGLVDCYLPPSEFLASLLIKRYHHAGSIRVLKNPIPTLQNDQGERTDTITYFGRLSEEKNLGLFLKAIPEVLKRKKVKIRIVGDGPDKKRLVALAQQEGVMDAMEFLPFVPHAELFSFISDAKVFVLTSKLYETFSLVLYEAIMAGLLPVVPAHGPMKEGVHWLKCGLLYESENHLDLADKLVEGLNDYSARLPALNRAKKKIALELNARKYIDNLLDIYRTVSATSC